MIRRQVVKLLYVSPMFLFSYSLQAQGVYITGANVVVDGNTNIVIQDGHLSQNGIFAPGAGNVTFTGSQATTNISGTPLVFNNLTIDKSAGEVVLDDNISVPGNLNMVSRHIQLNNNNIDLGTTGMIIGESNTSYITGTTGGTVLRTETLNAPAGVNPGNIGAEITTTANLGVTQITRGHVQQQGLTSGIGIARYFDIVPAAGSNTALNATVDFHYLEDELMGLGEAELMMSAKTAPMGWWFMIGEDGLNVTTNVLTKNGIDTFGRLTLTNELNNPLPIKLVSFNGRLLNGQTLLNWQVANETGITKYDLERSPDGKTFSKLGTVTAKGANAETFNYDYTDPAPYKGNTFYRLKVYENSGRTSLSKVIRVELNGALTLSVYPNPVTDKVVIDFDSAEPKSMTFNLLDAQGKLVQTKQVQATAGMNKVEWNLSALAAATYYLQLNGINNTQIKISKL